MFMRQLAAVTAGRRAAVRWVQDGVRADPSTMATTAIAVPETTTVSHTALVCPCCRNFLITKAKRLIVRCPVSILVTSCAGLETARKL